MNIGFDFDKIFIDYPPFIPSSIIDKLYRNKSNGILIYRIPTRFEQFIRLLTHFSFFRPPITKNVRFIRILAKKNTDRHFLISSRFSFLKNKTDNLIKKYKLGDCFDGMYFNFNNNQPHLFKDAMVKRLKINRYVDDDLSLLQYLSKKNTKISFFWLNNKIEEKLDKNLFAIKNLSNMLRTHL